MSYKKELKQKLTDAGVMGYTLLGDEVSADYAFSDVGLSGVPEVVAERLLSAEFNPDDSLSEIVDKWKKAGLLAFDPVIVMSENHYPSIALKYNRYLHLFRNYNFHISYTREGVGEYASANVRTDWMYNKIADAWRYCKASSSDSDLYQALMYMNLIACGTCLDSFNKLLKNNSELVDKFLAKCLKAWDLCYNTTMTYEKLRQYIVRADVNEDLEHEYIDIYRVPKSDTMDYCRLRIHSFDDVLVASIELMENGLPVIYKLELPEALNKDKVASLNDERLEDYNEAWDEFKRSSEFITSQVNFLLNTFGYEVNYQVCYPMLPELRKDNANVLKSINDANVIEFKSLSDLIVPKG